MAQTANHARSTSVPRFPFQTPVLDQTSYQEATDTMASDKLQSAEQVKTSKQPVLSVFTGFDNPRTPPPPGYVVEQVVKKNGHRRKESIQERRAKTKGEEVVVLNRSTNVIGMTTNMSPSDRTVVIGFDSAVKKLNIQTSINHIVSPIAPSIIVTGVPKDDTTIDDMFLNAKFDKHRSSVYSRTTNATQHIRQVVFLPGSVHSTPPPVPVVPYDLLNAASSQRSGVTSWATDMEDVEDDQSQTFVESVAPVKEEKDSVILLHQDVVITPASYRSKGWWNEITTPFLVQRSGTLKTKPSFASIAQHSPLPGDAGNKLTTENVAALDRSIETGETTTPHPADEKRMTMGFFAEATPATATFPSDIVPPVPELPRGQVVTSPYVDAGAFGLAAEYFEAYFHDEESDEPYYKCIGHDCSRWNKPRAVSDERQREIFNEMMAEEKAGAKRERELAYMMAGGAAAGMAAGVASDLAAGSHRNIYHAAMQTPSLNGYIDPSDSVSQVAERSLRRESVPSVPAIPRRTPQILSPIYSEGIASPQVAEALAVRMMPAISSKPTVVPEGVPGSVRKVPVLPTEAPHAELSREVPAEAVASSQAQSGMTLPAPKASVPALPPPPPAPSNIERAMHTPAPATQSKAAMPMAAVAGAAVGAIAGYELEKELNHHEKTEAISPPVDMSEIGVARSMSPPAVQTTASTALSGNPFARGPPLATLDTPKGGAEAVSPAAFTPSMSKDAAIGNAIPMQAPSVVAVASVRGIQTNAAPVELNPTVIMPAIEHIPEESHRAAPMPPMASAAPSPPQNVYLPPAGAMAISQVGETQDDSMDRALLEKPTQEKTPGKLATLLAKLKERRRKNRKPRTKEEKKRRRMCCGIFCCLLIMVIVIVLLVMLLAIPRHDIPAQSSWLNLTDFPALPTGVATIARPNAVKEQSGCVAPATMWSCALPREEQDNIKPNAPNQPNFRIEIRFQNNSQITNGTIAPSNKTRRGLEARDDFVNSLFTPNPAPPSDADQQFLGNTTDHVSAPFNGEATPFYISFLPTNAEGNSNSNAFGKRQDGSTPSLSRRSGSSNTSTTTVSTSHPSSTSSAAAPSASDFFPNVTANIPPPAINPDGTVAQATLYPLPSAQPLRLYNRDKADEHYGFYTYFDRSIFLTSATLSNHTYSYNTADIPGGSAADTASLRCTWAQTRFLVQIWTRKDVASARLLNGSATAEAAAAGNITADSQSDWSQPGSFPYPVTVTLDRHGGDARAKMLYCYDMLGNRVNDTTAKLSFEDRAFAGTIVNPVGGFFDVGGNGNGNGNAGSGSNNGSPAATGGIDGGTGGCSCSWQNWQQVGGDDDGSGTGSGALDGSGGILGQNSARSEERKRRTSRFRRS